MIRNKAYKFLLLPNAEQCEYFAKCFGCVRFVYNHMLADKISYYKEFGKTLRNTPAQYKDEFDWLREVDALALANAQLQLQTAYTNFFRDPKIGFPKFRSKKSGKNSYTTNNQARIFVLKAVVSNCPRSVSSSSSNTEQFQKRIGSNPRQSRSPRPVDIQSLF